MPEKASKPKETSTPKSSVRGRPTYQTQIPISPIASVVTESISPLSVQKKTSTGNSDSDNDVDSDELHSPTGNVDNEEVNVETKESNKIREVVKNEIKEQSWTEICIYFIIIGIAVISSIHYAGVGVQTKSFEPESKIDLNSIIKTFPTQSEDFWIAVKSGITEVQKYNKPSVYILLYKEESEETLNRLLKNISSYASCILNSDCSFGERVLELSSEQLSTPQAIKDFGYVLEKYASPLREKSIMIVRNFDRVPGSVAPAFHTFCDEFEPLVEKAVFFFTIKVQEFPQNAFQYVEDVLRNNWRDIKQDHFEPLFTRVSSMILTVEKEDNISNSN